MSACKSCGAEVVFAYTPNGKIMPVDKEPCADGNVSLRMDGGDMYAVVLSAAGAASANKPLHSSHFRTCPNAKQHRSKR